MVPLLVASLQSRLENKKDGFQRIIVFATTFCIVTVFMLRNDILLIDDSMSNNGSIVQKNISNWNTTPGSSNKNYSSNRNDDNSTVARLDYITEIVHLEPATDESNNEFPPNRNQSVEVDKQISDNISSYSDEDKSSNTNDAAAVNLLTSDETGKLKMDDTVSSHDNGSIIEKKTIKSVTAAAGKAIQEAGTRTPDGRIPNYRNDSHIENNTAPTSDTSHNDTKQTSGIVAKLDSVNEKSIYSNDTIKETDTIVATLVAEKGEKQLTDETRKSETEAAVVNDEKSKNNAVPTDPTTMIESYTNDTSSISLFTLNSDWKNVCAKSLKIFGTNIQRTIEYNQKDSAHMGPFTDSGFNGKYCSTILQNPSSNDSTTQSYTWDTIPTTMINITFSCGQLFYESKAVGTGNFISLFYTIRLIAIQSGNIDVNIQCSDANTTNDRLILPWLTGTFPRSDWTQIQIAGLRTKPTMLEACAQYTKSPIGYIVESSIYELRRMAIALVGIPSQSHPAYEWAEQYLWSNEAQNSIQNQQLTLPAPKKDDVPLLNISNFEIDDVAIHFRCGDIIQSRHPSFGFMKFESFSRYIQKDTTTSIGIVTSPLEPSTQVRSSDKGKDKIYRCKKVINLFVEHLQTKFSNNTKISVRNDPNESIAATYARMIMAKQTIIGISSFGVFGGLASFGTSYIRKPDYVKAPNRFLVNHPNISQLAPNVHLITEPRLMAKDVRDSWPKDDGESVMRWFQNYNVKNLNN
jgi:hypothetical protein